MSCSPASLAERDSPALVPVDGRGPFSPRRISGFSLLELIVVLALVSVIAGMVAPMFGSTMSSIQFRNARNDLIGLIQFVQEMAVRDSREYRVYLDKKENLYWVERLVEQKGTVKVFEPVKEFWGEKTRLPDYIELTQVRARKSRGSNEQYIGCYPNGASDEARVTIQDKRRRGRLMRLEVSGVLGRVDVVRER